MFRYHCLSALVRCFNSSSTTALGLAYVARVLTAREVFQIILARVYRRSARYGKQYRLLFSYEPEQEDGKGIKTKKAPARAGAFKGYFDA